MTKRVIAIYAQNISDFKHSKLFNIPIGIANRKWAHGNNDIFAQQIKKFRSSPVAHKKLLYLNFSLSTYPERRKVYELFKDKAYCTVSEPTNLSKYLNDLAHHVFTLSPRGNGLDCHRTWEALLMGSIPIVITSSLDPLYKDLPVLIINDWKEITEEFLIAKFQEMNSKPFKKNKIYFDYWLNKIKKTQTNFRKK